MSFQNFDILSLAGRIGAEIVGVDLSANLSNSIISDIRKALVQYKVIFFRRQELDAKGQVAFAGRFGQVTTAHPTMSSLSEHPEVLDLDYGQNATTPNSWHTDVTFVDRPPFGSILRALVIPPSGGDTIWANTVTAYQDLPSYLRSLADELWAVHSNFKYDYAAAAVDDLDDFIRTIYKTIHPVVRVHPESGERGILLGGFVRQIYGLSPIESADIIRLLQSYVTRPENTVRWHWQVGDVVFWDNRATQHYALADYGDQPRHVQRVTIAGDLPASIDGKRSRAIEGDCSAYIRSLVAV